MPKTTVMHKSPSAIWCITTDHEKAHRHIYIILLVLAVLLAATLGSVFGQFG